jgi:hypothetical protein
MLEGPPSSPLSVPVSPDDATRTATGGITPYTWSIVSAGSNVVVILNGISGVMVMLNCAVVVTCGASESATCTVKFAVPAQVGAPVIVPVLLFRLNPIGRLPTVMLQVYEVIPPVVVRVAS